MHGLIHNFEQYKSVLNSFLLDVAIIDRDHKVIFQNTVCEETYGEKLGEYCFKAFGKHNEICENCRFSNVFNSEEPSELEQNGGCVISSIQNGDKKTPAFLIFPRNVTKQKVLEKKLRKAVKLAQDERAKVEAIVASIGDGMIIQDRSFKILYMNDALKNMVGDHVGEFCYKAIHDKESICEDCQVEKAFNDGKIHTREQKVLIGKDTKYVENTASPLRNASGEIIGAVEIVRNITRRKKAEDALKKAKDELEYQVEKRTAELSRKNIALKEILEQIELEKKQMAERVRTNVDKLLLPTIKKIKRESPRVDREYINILEKNIKELTSSFGVKLTSKEMNLTPKEIDICILIKEGFTGKEIAKMHNLSFKTIASHRYNIRRKLGISSQKINLATYLNSL
jgi:PAS domain S-box-containing protein